MRCPLCQSELSDPANGCTRCDWTPRKIGPPPATVRDDIAFWLSLAPGLGHLYKGYVLVGGLIFFVIGPAILALALAVLPTTLGLSLIVPLAFVAFVMLHAYRAKDHRKETIEAARRADRLQPAH